MMSPYDRNSHHSCLIAPILSGGKLRTALWGQESLLRYVVAERFLTKQLNVDLLKCMDTAELVQLMMDLVEDKGLVVVSSVVLHYVIH